MQEQAAGYSMSVCPADFDFGTAAPGYEPIDPLAFTIQNTGTVPLVDLRFSAGEQDLEKFWFCLAHTRERLEPGDSFAIYAYPRDRLLVGVHTAALSIEAKGLDAMDFRLCFTVTEHDLSVCD